MAGRRAEGGVAFTVMDLRGLLAQRPAIYAQAARQVGQARPFRHERLFVPGRLFGSFGSLFNLSGQKIGDNYRGIIIRNGRKILKK